MTESATLEDRIRRVVAEVLGLRLVDVTLETSHQTVDDWESLNMINLVMAVESEFGVSLEIEEAAQFVSVMAIVRILREHGVT